MGCPCNRKKMPSVKEQAENAVLSIANAIGFAVRHRKIFLPGETIKKRVDTCLTCDRLDAPSSRCSECGCFVNAKAAMASEKCPLDRW